MIQTTSVTTSTLRPERAMHGWYNVLVSFKYFLDLAKEDGGMGETHNAVETVEGGVKIRTGPQPIHLYTHLWHKDPQEDELSKVWIEERERETDRDKGQRYREKTESHIWKHT